MKLGGAEHKFTAQAANKSAQLIRELAGRLDLQDARDQGLLQACHSAARLLQHFEDNLEPVNIHQGILQMRGRVSAEKLPFQSDFLIKAMLMSYHLRDAGALRTKASRSSWDHMMAKMNSSGQGS